MKIFLHLIIYIISIYSNVSTATCESNVDNIETFYVNGMFTDYSDFLNNQDALDKFIQENLSDQGFSNPINGAHNESEFVLVQALEVLRQKIEDGENAEAIIEFINGDDNYLDTLTDINQIQDFLININDYYTLAEDDFDQQKVNSGVKELLDTCSRVIIITHSLTR